MIPFMVMACSPAQSDNSVEPSSAPKGSSAQPTSQHTHNWSNEWTNDDTQHWHACDGCNEKNAVANHTFGAWETYNLGERLNNPTFNLSTVKSRKCSVCNYVQLDSNQSVLPEVRFNFEATNSKGEAQVMDFATRAKSTDKSRPTVEGKFSITNAGDKNVEELAKTTMKVRGNQTAGFDKKGFQIKFDKKQNLLGLNGGKKFKKWVLLADAKDITISRTALGLSMCKGVIAEDSNVWSSDFTPVSVYLNDTYWGLYMLAEQKEVKSGRIKLDEPEEEVGVVDENGEPVLDKDGKQKTETVPITTTDIGYCFELDYYAKDEPSKDDGGDPTFSIEYDGVTGGNGNTFNVESGLANSGLGLVKSYTMNSDITDSTAEEGKPINASNSNQVKFMQQKLTALFKVLHQAVANKKTFDINENNQAVEVTGKTIKEVIEKNFDLNAWAEGFIINAVCCPPDLGYSSFYMSFDNSPNGDHKLRFDVPWDFDSNFGNRANFIESADTASTSGGNQWGGAGGGQSYGPYYMDRTANLWLQYLNKLDFFMNDYVKPKWQAAVSNKVFSGMLDMIDIMYTYYEVEYQKNFAKWPNVNPSNDQNLSYFANELRNPFKQVSDRKAAQEETINWLTKRINYLNGLWGASK